MKKIGENLPCTFLKKRWLKLSIYFLKQKNNEEKWSGIFLYHFFSPLIFGTVSPLKEGKECVWNPRGDSRKGISTNIWNLLLYWITVVLINIAVCVIIMSLFKEKVRTEILIMYFIFTFFYQLGYGIRWRIRLGSETPNIVTQGLAIFAVFFVSCYVLVYYISKDDFVNILATIYLILICISLFTNTVLLLILKATKEFKKADVQEKSFLIISNSMVIATFIMITIIFAYPFGNKITQGLDLTVGYSTYLTLLVGITSAAGVFVNLLSDKFFGKPVIHFIIKVSKNINMLIGIRCLFSSFILIFLFEPIFVLYNVWKYTYPPFLQYDIVVSAIVLLLIATVFLLIYFFQVSYAIKSYSEHDRDPFLNMTKWFGEILVDNVTKNNLILDEYSQDHLIERLTELEEITNLEIVEIFNSNSEFEKRESQNTVILAIFKYLNKEYIPSFLNLQRDRLSVLEYTDTSMKTELEKLQKKYGVFTPQINEIELQTKTSENSFLKKLINGIFCKNKKSI